MKLLTACLILFLCGSSIGRSGAVPQDPVSLLGGGRPITAPSTPGERAVRESASFSASSDSVLAQARSHFNGYQSEKRREAEARNKAGAARRKIIDSQAQKERELDEYRKGEFCTGCNRTKSDILSHDPPPAIFPHKGQEIRAATPAELKAKEQEWDGKISQARAEEYRAVQEADACLQRKLAESQEVQNSMIRWRTSMAAEDDARGVSWDRAVKTYKQRFEAGQEAIRRLDSDLARARAKELKHPNQITEMETQRQVYRGLMGQLTKDAEADYFSKNREAALFDQRLSKGRAELDTLWRAVDGPFQSSDTFFPAIAGKVPGTKVGVNLSPDSIGVNVGGGPGGLRMSLRASENWLRQTLHVDVTVGIDTGLSPLEGGIRLTTNPDGSQTLRPIGSAPKPIGPPDPLELLKGTTGGKNP